MTGITCQSYTSEHEVRLRKTLERELPSEAPFLHSSIGQSALVAADTVLMGAGRKISWP